MARLPKTKRQLLQRVMWCALMQLSFFCTTGLAQYTVRWTDNAVEVAGISAATLRRVPASQWQRVLSIYAGADESLPPMLGTYRVAANVLRFTPQFPLEPGVSYRAVFRPAALPGQGKTKAAPIIATFHKPARANAAATVVSQVYPSADVLPENLLKFYLTFSAPMSRGRSYEHIQLLDAQGQRVELPFLELDEELWNPEMTRFTLLIDPGRIKRGVLPLEQIGPSLEEGKSYTLVISRAWRDGQGQPLAADFRKSFRVATSDRIPIDPQKWALEMPASASRDPLVIGFGEPLDYALAQRVITVVAANGVAIKGIVALVERERLWGFRPDQPWQAGTYQLLIETTLEDIAGNNIGKPFEVDLFEGVQRRLETQTVKLPFTIR